ncbi:hypothetical protein BC937DRAFT_86423 [Endogone sp. FLAS-F59071]|nr:hypothetical protein BC937DRAFT_86423 [Endogone sp. FLAS-F59071]|eukprot:RUS22839.1 hypothetical protein BC937DRAFT_86423 [Endogone sp. FLAS-F59071]
MRSSSSVRNRVFLLLLGALLISAVNAQSSSEISVATSVSPSSAAATSAVSVSSGSAASSSASPSTSVVSASVSLSASSTASTPATVTGCLGASYDTSTDFFPNKVQLSEYKGVFLDEKMTRFARINECIYTLYGSSGFSVQYYKFYKIITNFKTQEYYMLYCSQLPPNISGVHTKGVIQIPVTTVAALDMESIGFLDLLGQSNTVKYVADPNNLTSPCISTTPETFTSSATDAGVVFSSTLEPNDPRYVTVSIDNTMTPLQKAEWVKFFSIFFDQEATATTIYNNIVSQYNCHKSNMANAQINERRNVTWLSWDPNGPSFDFQTDNFYSTITSDAGAYFITPSNDRIFDNATLRGQLENVSHLIDQTPFSQKDDNINTWMSLAGYSSSEINASSTKALAAAQANLNQYVNSPDAPPFMRYRRVWRLDELVNAQFISDFSNRGSSRPDLLLQDLIAAQFPKYQTWNRVFLRNLSSETSSQPSSSNYGCGNPSFGNCQSSSFYDSSSDNPLITVSSSSADLSLAAKIGLGVAGGVVVLAFLAGSFAAVRRRYKERKGKRQTFTRLAASDGEAFEMPRGGEAIYDDDQQLTEPEGRGVGRFGGGGRGVNA